MNRGKKLLFAAVKEAIFEYAQMSRTEQEPHESFIQHIAARRIWRETGWVVRIEFPARDTSIWGLERNALVHLSRDFLIDLVCLEVQGGKTADLRMLVEFKRWTEATDVVKDVNRLQELLGVVARANEASGTRPESYVVCVPHYSSLARVRKAISDLTNHFVFDPEDEFSAAAFETGKEGGPAAGIVILDAANCMRN